LQEQNEKAAEQREKQIQLLQSQLDYAIKSGEIWNEVYALIEGGLDPVDGLVRGSALESLLKRKDGFLGLSELGKMEWLKELEAQAAQAAVYLSDLKSIKPVVNYNTYEYYGGEVENEEEPKNTGGGNYFVPPTEPNTPAESTTFKVYHKSSGQTFYSTGTVDEIKDKFSNNDYYVEFAKDGSPVSGYSKPFSKQS
jgi:hypothetical protein